MGMNLHRSGFKLLGQLQPPFFKQGYFGINRFQAFANLRQRHDAMLTSYRNRDWGAARQQMPYLTEHGKALGLASLYALYGDRIETLAAKPPPDGWDGIYDAPSK